MRSLLLATLFLTSLAVTANVGPTVDKIAGAMPGNALNEEDPALDQAIKLGEPAFGYLCSKLAEADGNKDGKYRWLMHGLTHRILGTKNAPARKAMESALLKALQSGKHGPEASTFLLRELRWIGTADAVAPIGAIAKDAPALTTAATQCLAAMANILPHPPIAAQLRAALPGKTGEAKANLIKSLGSLRDSRAVPTFLEAAGSNDAQIRRAALRALANTGDSRGQTTLKKAADSATGYESNLAVSWYLQYAERRTELKDPDTAAAIAREVFASRTAPEHGHLQCRALTVLATALGEKAVPELTAALENQSAYVADRAAILLSQIPGEGVTRQIAAKLASPDAGTRLAAVGFLAKRTDSAAGPAIAKALTDKDPAVRQAAVDAAVSLQLTSAVPTLIDILGNGSADDREAAVVALQAIPGDAVSSQLATALPKQSAAAQEAVIEVLQARGARAQAPAVLAAAKSTDSKVSRAALKALNGLATPELLPALIDNMLASDSGSARKRWQNAIVTTTTQIEEPSARIAPLAASLGKAKGAPREDLVEAIGRIGGPAALNLLRKELASTHADQLKNAVRVLSKWPDAAPAADLLKVAESATDEAVATLALVGFLNLAEKSPASVTADHAKRAVAAAKRPEDRQRAQALVKTLAGGVEPNLVWFAPFTGSSAPKVAAGTSLTTSGKSTKDGLALSDNGARIKNIGPLKTLINSANFSVAAWIKPNDVSAKQRLLCSVNRSGWGFGLNGSALEITTFTVLDHTGPQGIIVPKQWQHVAVTFDKKNTARLYHNGTLVATIPNGAGPVPYSADELAIGNFPGTGESYAGLIRDLRIYDTVLSDQRLKELFDRDAKQFAAKPGKKPAPQAAAKPKPTKKAGPPRGPSGQSEPASAEIFDYGDNPERGFVSVFNGRDLTGWKGDVNGYYVENGELRCSTKGGRLFLNDEYSDFVLRFDFKLTPGANNGLGIRTPMQGDPAYAGMELQILDNTSPKYAKLKEWQYHGSIYGVVPAKRGHLKPVGEWNTQEVIAIGDHVKIILNGTVITDAYLDLVEPAPEHKGKHHGLHNDKGHVGFLGHGAEVAFKNVRIRDYSVPAPEPGTADNTPPAGFDALFNGKDLANWQGLVANPPKRQAMAKDELAKAFEKANASMRQHWSVKDGVLIFDGKGQSLCTEKLYGDFDLYVDWKIHPKGDSGLYLRGTPQLQIWDPTNKGQWKHGADKGSGCLWNNKFEGQRPLVKADNPIGEWNTFLVRMVNDRVTCYLNGKKVLNEVILENYWQRNLPIYRKEQIELQNHGNTLYFKNVYVRELPY